MNRETYRIIPYYGHNYLIHSLSPFRHNPIFKVPEAASAMICANLKTPIDRKYCWLRQLGGFEGDPVTPEHTVSDGVGRARAYKNGMGYWSIWWHPDTGVHEVHGAIHEKWFSLGYQLFGYPITDELTTPDGRGRYNHFRAVHLPNKPKLSIYWHPETGAHEVHGAIRDKWAELGWEKSHLGYPITDELTTPDGLGRYNHFLHVGRLHKGSIYWTPETGAHEVHGAIRDKWASLGWERFGYPITDELTTPDGFGRYNHFRAIHLPGKPEASIYLTHHAAYAVYGAIRTKWAELGWEKSPLGYPTSDEKDRPGGGRVQEFEQGEIRWDPRTGAHVEIYQFPTPPPAPTPPPTLPSSIKPTLNVSKQGSKLVVTGSNFKRNASIRIRFVVGLIGNETSVYTNSDSNGGFKHEEDLTGVPVGTTIWISATDGTPVPPSQDKTGFLWSNTVPITR